MILAEDLRQFTTRGMSTPLNLILARFNSNFSSRPHLQLEWELYIMETLLGDGEEIKHLGATG